MKLTREELDGRRLRFVAAMNEAFPLWDTALIVSNVNQYYFTGTMQNALLLIKSDGSYGCYVRKSWRRACDESPLEAIFPIKTYRDAADHAGKALGNTYIEAEVMPVAMLERIKSAFSV
ncbi:MAG: aminopeptidase P family N-terminal domain-containing protein, partial [Christensenellales bacterium]